MRQVFLLKNVFKSNHPVLFCSYNLRQHNFQKQCSVEVFQKDMSFRIRSGKVYKKDVLYVVNCSWDQITIFTGEDYASFILTFYTASTFYDRIWNFYLFGMPNPSMRVNAICLWTPIMGPISQEIVQKHCLAFSCIVRANHDSMPMKFSPQPIFTEFFLKDEAKYEPNFHNTQMMILNFWTACLSFLVPKTETVLKDIHSVPPILLCQSLSFLKAFPAEGWFQEQCWRHFSNVISFFIH